MSLNTHIRYTLTCDKCGSLYFKGYCNVQYADSKVLVSHARIDGWDIALSSNGRSYDCICPDCKGKEGAK